MNDTSGPIYGELFAIYDPESSSWKTSQGTFPWDSGEFSGTWPKNGTTHDGHAYERQTWEHHTDENEYSSLLPTPTASQPGGTAEQMLARKARMKGGPRATVTDLWMVIEQLLPTPTATDAKGSRNTTGNPSGHDGMTLTDWAWTQTGVGTPQRSNDGNTPSDDPPPTLFDQEPDS